MHCLKCGAEVEAPQVFCAYCQAEMAAYPVSRETPAMLPPRPKTDGERRVLRPTPPKPEVIIARLRKRQKWLLGISLTLLAGCLLLGMLLIFAPGLSHTKPTIGQNYNITDVTDPTGT